MAEKSALVKNAGDAEQVQKAGEKEKSRRQTELNDMVWILSDARGRRFLWRLLAKCGVFKSSFTGNSTTFFNEGMRDVGLWATAEITEAKPEGYLEMMLEAHNEDKNNGK